MVLYFIQIMDKVIKIKLTGKLMIVMIWLTLFCQLLDISENTSPTGYLML